MDDSEEYLRGLLRQDVKDLARESGLSELEQRVLGLHFGLDDGNEHTVEEMAEICKLTKEQAKQTLRAGILKLGRRK